MINYSYRFSDFLAPDFSFEKAAMQLLHYQYTKNPVYQKYVNDLGIDQKRIRTTTNIPFLPVEVFKEKVVKTSKETEIIFTSSGTTGFQTSRHYVHDLNLYEQSFMKSFELFYGPVSNYCVLALLPGYLERQGSSLIYMADYFIKQSKYKQSGFYLYEHDDLEKVLKHNEQQNIPTLLLGVTFALLDFAETHQLNLKNTIVMETGGMKGRQKEMIREEVHEILKSGFGVQKIHSEYGMTELLSQAYSHGEGLYSTPPWMKVFVYDFYNPLNTETVGKGGINIIDLANAHSCPFIQTRDIGELFPDGTFQVLGRFDQSDIRGCNLMVI